MDFSIFPILGQGIFLTSLTLTCLKIIRTKSSRDFSIPGVCWSTSAILLLLVYAAHIREVKHEVVLFYTYSVNFATNLIYLYLVIRYRNGQPNPLRSLEPQSAKVQP